MSKGGPVGEEEEKAILAALKAGRSVRDVAEEFQRGTGTISRIAKRNGLDLVERSSTKRAALIKSCYASEDRIKLIGEALNKGRELLKSCDNPRDFQYLMTGFAIGFDKRRLEEATDPSARGGEIAELFQRMREEARP
ncbi:MAG: helix-turn-helix domain-containing protein [Euryarchaeota archaeon]|nr:helix-turn-helix domain-containing protein [Euryarchaeota archaeon]